LKGNGVTLTYRMVGGAARAPHCVSGFAGASRKRLAAGGGGFGIGASPSLAARHKS